MTQNSKCPICKKPTVTEFRPFCSSRCQKVDLGRWLGGHYAVPGEEVAPANDFESEDK